MGRQVTAETKERGIIMASYCIHNQEYIVDVNSPVMHTARYVMNILMVLR